jgi:hypothetical protein
MNLAKRCFFKTKIVADFDLPQKACYIEIAISAKKLSNGTNL